MSRVSVGESLFLHSNWLYLFYIQGKNITIHKSDAWVLKLSYFLHKHQMKVTKNSQAVYSGHTWVCVMVKLILL